LIASVPLLLLVSGPYFLQSIFGISLVGIIAGSAGAGRTLKVIKAIRVTRILRFIRMLKIFGKIKNVQSRMTQRHITRLSTLIVFSLSFFFITTSLLQSLELIPSATTSVKMRQDAIIRHIADSDKFISDIERDKYLKSITENNPAIVYLEYNGKPLCNKLVKNKNGTTLPLDIKKIDKESQRETAIYTINKEIANLEIIFSETGTLRSEAIIDMINFVMILFMMVIILLFYSPHFAKTVTDPIFVMRKGFETRNYTLMVKIPEHLKDDDVFKLAEDYNDRWLPAKLRKLNDEPQLRPKLTLDDILKDLD